MQTRFVLANQSVPKSSDGTCFVITPHATPAAPAFNHGRNELWLPDDSTYKGFRIPERTGCFWYAEVSHRDGQMNATRPPVCAGRVLEVLTPSGVDLTGLPSGLMRSAAFDRYAALPEPSSDDTQPTAAYRLSLSPAEQGYVLRGVHRDSANESFFQMVCDVAPTWAIVESLVTDLVDSAALLACGGDTVRIIPCTGGNCSVSDHPVAVLYAPSIDGALANRFSSEEMLSGVPSGVVLLKVDASSRCPRAKSVADVLRADRVGSESPDLVDGPTRVPNSSVTMDLGAIFICELQDLRPCLVERTLGSGRALLSALLPGVYT
jgi:hypothetical protein